VVKKNLPSPKQKGNNRATEWTLPKGEMIRRTTPKNGGGEKEEDNSFGYATSGVGEERSSWLKFAWVNGGRGKIKKRGDKESR